nr:MAG TPA: hypothetical protein [Caudoviricetes sp.]
MPGFSAALYSSYPPFFYTACRCLRRGRLFLRLFQAT